MRPNDLWKKLAEPFFFLEKDSHVVGLSPRLTLEADQSPGEREAMVRFQAVHSAHLYFLYEVQQLPDIHHKHLACAVKMVWFRMNGGSVFQVTVTDR